MNILRRLIDERFLEYRRRSTALAGQFGAILAFSLFAYRYYVDHVWSWELLAVPLTFAAIKVAMMSWYLLSN